jgi:Fe-S oxidoreductase
VVSDAYGGALKTTLLTPLRNEYPAYSLDEPVYHYTELLVELLSRGRITLPAPLRRGAARGGARRRR